MGDFKRRTQRKLSRLHAKATGDPMRPWPSRRTKERQQQSMTAATEGGADDLSNPLPAARRMDVRRRL
jgi:hypothetical protein